MVKDQYLPIIKEQVKYTRKKYGLSPEGAIGDYIFSVLKNECCLIEWPEPTEPNLDGFSTEKVINGKLVTVVYINTAKNKEKQNFCAAHELGHRYAIDRLIRDEFCDEVITPHAVEEIMNRFAAELLMPEKSFKTKAAKLYKRCLVINKDEKLVLFRRLLDAIVELMDFYYVPYKAVVTRLKETEIISAHLENYLISYGESDKGRDVIDAVIYECGATRLRHPDHKIQYSELIEDLKDIVQKENITRYMNPNELKKYLKDMGLLEEDIELLEEMKKIEEKTIDIERL